MSKCAVFIVNLLMLSTGIISIKKCRSNANLHWSLSNILKKRQACITWFLWAQILFIIENLPFITEICLVWLKLEFYTLIWSPSLTLSAQGLVTWIRMGTTLFIFQISPFLFHNGAEWTFFNMEKTICTKPLLNLWTS